MKDARFRHGFVSHGFGSQVNFLLASCAYATYVYLSRNLAGESDYAEDVSKDLPSISRQSSGSRYDPSAKSEPVHGARGRGFSLATTPSRAKPNAC
jgi:hypothetical protein